MLRQTAAVLLVAAALAAPRNAGAVDPKDFGFGLNKAEGTRPLLVIWVRQPDDAPTEKLARYRQYYQDLIFGKAGQAAAAPSPQPDAGDLSVLGYYREISDGKFGWRRVGFLGPLTAQVKIPRIQDIARLAIEAAAKEARFNFKALDLNKDGVLGPDELTVLVLANSKLDEGAAANFSAPGHAVQIPGQGLAFAGKFAVVGEGGSFGTVNHELFHVLAPSSRDIYGHPHNCFGTNSRSSLMAATVVRELDWKESFHLDPWHKMLAGWAEPRLHAVDAAGKVQLAAQHVPLRHEPEQKRPVLLYDARKGPSEFFLLEYRTPNPSGYDRNVGGSGLMIWHVLLNNRKQLFLLDADRKNCKDQLLKIWSLNVRGAPDWQIGVVRAYTAQQASIALKWMNGDDSGARIRVEPHRPQDAKIDVTWTAPEADAPLTVVRVTQATYGANCGAPAGNLTAPLVNACNGRTSCTYRLDHKVVGDPKPHCHKDFKVSWRCGRLERSAEVAPPSGLGEDVYLYC